jgi:uncharacterized membrane protein YvlD (DUF360 family)
MASEGMSMPARLIIRAVLSVLLVWGMAVYLEPYFVVTGGVGAYVVIGSLLTLMNIVVRPLLDAITLPLKLFATILAIIIVNGAFVQLTVMVTDRMQPEVVTLRIDGGLWGWIVVAVILGVGNWVMKVMLSR